MDIVRDQSKELLEEWDWITAKPTGKAVLRGIAHRNGIAHEGVHLWILRTQGDEVEILMQKRAHHKEMYPSCLDITVGGHVTFGISGGKIQKEAYEEIGIELVEEKLIDLGYFRYEEKDNEIFHREFQRVYLYVDNRNLSEYRFTDGEVEGIYAVRISDLKHLMNNDFEFEIFGYDGERLVKEKVSRKDFHPLLFSPSMKDYMKVLFVAIDELIKKKRVSVKIPLP
ncbi:MAG: NUDIX domain-containing protein [Spirochaetes bacterium]|nr:NUDIX domain-containing protein [Spirochaetota bacterium]